MTPLQQERRPANTPWGVQFALLWPCLLAGVLLFSWFAFDGDVGSDIDFSDEGYLWYGTRAMKAGQVPIRDFQAYDPGRYVWTAAWSYLLGDSLVAMRLACVIFGWIGVTAGVLAARRISGHWLFQAVMVASLVLWMFPRYKVFEQAIALMGVYAAVRLIERPTVRQHFASGIFVGLMAFMGRNHGLYLFVAFALVITLLAKSVRDFSRAGLMWGAGIFVGYLPQLAMLAMAPGYLAAHLELLNLGKRVGTNLGMPVPWPWNVSPWLYHDAWLHAMSEGCFFVALIVFPAAAVVRATMIRRRVLDHPLFVAASAVTLPYAHYAFSRPDTFHLTHSVPPLILAVVALCHTFPRSVARWLTYAAAGGLLALTLPLSLYYARAYSVAVRPPGSYVQRVVGGASMRLSREQARILDVALEIANERAAPGDAILYLPHFPGLYPATNRFSPVRQIYFIFPALLSEEAVTLARLRETDVKWVMLQDVRLDGRDDLRFRNTNPLLYRFLEEQFEIVSMSEVAKSVSVFRRKSQ